MNLFKDGRLLGVVFVLAGLWVWFRFDGRTSQPRPSEVTLTESRSMDAGQVASLSTAAQSTVPPRPSWMRFDRAVTSATIRRYDELAVLAHQLPVRPLGGPVTNTRALARLRAARARIARTAALPQAWQWAEVQQVVARIGSDIPLLQATETDIQGHRDSTVMIWVGPAQDFVFWPAAIERSTDYDLDGLLVHEATHAVYQRAMMTWTGYDQLELATISDACRDVGRQLTLTDEANAMLNQAAYQYRPGTTAADRISHAHDIPITIGFAARALNGDVAARRDFVRDMLSYVSATRYDARQGPTMPLQCWPSIIVHGPRRGQLFLPSDVVPRMVPYLEVVPSLVPH